MTPKRQRDREIAEPLAHKDKPPTVVVSIRLSGLPAPMQTREFKRRADSQAWLDQQREIAGRHCWRGYRFELTETCEAERKGR